MTKLSVTKWKATPWLSAAGTDRAAHSNRRSRHVVVRERSSPTRRRPDCWITYRQTANAAATKVGFSGSSTGNSSCTRPTAVATYVATQTSSRSHPAVLAARRGAAISSAAGVCGAGPSSLGTCSGSRIRPAPTFALLGILLPKRNHHASVFPLVHLPAAIDGTGTPHRKTKATAEAGVKGARKSPLVASTLRWGSKTFRGGR